MNYFILKEKQIFKLQKKFMAAAIQGLCANPEYITKRNLINSSELCDEYVHLGEDAIAIADQCIKELEMQLLVEKEDEEHRKTVYDKLKNDIMK
jgi:hypothetical protein